MNTDRYLQKSDTTTPLSYAEYISLVTQLVSQGKTNGVKQSAALSEFTALNLKRMQRLDKTVKLNGEILHALKELPINLSWTVITESWCGDSAQNLPVLAKIANASNGKINLTIVFREENPQMMDTYMTNCSRSVPKLIARDTQGNDLFVWGPRPAEAQELLIAWKESPNGRNWEAFEQDLHLWYFRDKTRSIQKELIQILIQYMVMPENNLAIASK